jgi:hypothetical protein
METNYQETEVFNLLDSCLQQIGLTKLESIYSKVIQDQKEKVYAHTYKINHRRGSHVCYHRLAGEECPNEYCNSPQMIPLADHTSEWTKNGKTERIVLQPYVIGINDLENLISFCHTHGFDLEINSKLSWHKPGSTTLIALKKK